MEIAQAENLTRDIIMILIMMMIIIIIIIIIGAETDLQFDVN